MVLICLNSLLPLHNDKFFKFVWFRCCSTIWTQEIKRVIFFFFFKSLVLPGPEVCRMGMSIIQGQEVIFFFYGKWQEDELDSTSFLPNNDPGAVCSIGIAIGKTWRFYTAISAFQCAATCVDKTLKREKREHFNYFNIVVSIYVQ